MDWGGNEMVLMSNNDGTWSAHDETYDIVIHCDTKEENERVRELLKNEPISKKDVLEIIKETGGCDASDDFSKGWDMACDAIAKKVSERL